MAHVCRPTVSWPPYCNIAVKLHVFFLSSTTIPLLIRGGNLLMGSMMQINRVLEETFRHLVIDKNGMIEAIC